MSRAQRRRRRRWRSPRWGHSRGLTNRIISIVVDETRPAGVSRKAWRRRIVTSRKRSATFGNPGSDHHVSQRTADAIDFAFANAFRLRDRVMRRLGVTVTVEDFGAYTVEHRGWRGRVRTFRVQPIAATHGTGPHLHFGVRRIG